MNYNTATNTVTYTEGLDLYVGKQANASGDRFVDINQDGLVDNIYAEYAQSNTIVNNTVYYSLSVVNGSVMPYAVENVDLGASIYNDYDSVAKQVKRDLAAYCSDTILGQEHTADGKSKRVEFTDSVKYLKWKSSAPVGVSRGTVHAEHANYFLWDTITLYRSALLGFKGTILWCQRQFDWFWGFG